MKKAELNWLLKQLAILGGKYISQNKLELAKNCFTVIHNVIVTNKLSESEVQLVGLTIAELPDGFPIST